MPRRSAAAVADTRAEVLDVALRRASIDGLEGLTIGRLADELAMSKSGLFGLFGSKEELQLATFDAAVAHFTQKVW
jgi:AcrR family transcriptional regulator